MYNISKNDKELIFSSFNKINNTVIIKKVQTKAIMI